MHYLNIYRYRNDRSLKRLNASHPPTYLRYPGHGVPGRGAERRALHPRRRRLSKRQDPSSGACALDHEEGLELMLCRTNTCTHAYDRIYMAHL